MTLQDLGSLGEFIGVFAVMASLVYVAAQLRQNTRSLRASSFQGAMQNASQHMRLLAQNPEVAALYLRGLDSYNALDPVQRARFGSIMTDNVWAFEVTLSLHEEGIYSDTRLAAHITGLLSELSSQGGAEWWEEAAGTFDEKVRSYIESQRQAQAESPR